MSPDQLAARVAEYEVRLARGAASRIRPEHVQTVLEKLRRATADLEAELASAPSGAGKARLQRKLAVAREHVARAEWLLDRIA